jgi:hypothetical protein
MALSGYCSSCQRTVYVGDGDTPVCPVCSTLLLETSEGSNGDPREAGDAQPRP